MKTNRYIRNQFKWHVLLIILLCIMFYPLLFMVFTSLKSLPDIFATGLNILPMSPTLENYSYIFRTTPVLLFLWNSFIIASVVMVAKIVTSVLASYCLVFMDIPYRDAIFYFFSLTLFVPFSVIMIPNYITLNKFGLINHLMGVALPQMADAMGIFRIRQAMRTIPKSLVEAAKLDRVKHFTVLTQIVLPLTKPAVVSMAIFFFINSWNEFFWPQLILKSEKLSTITLGMQYFQNSEAGTAWGTSMALASIATLVPMLLYVVAQRQIISTFMQSGIKE